MNSKRDTPCCSQGANSCSYAVA